MSKCKYYMNGICYSPLTIKTFGEPSREPTNPDICLGNKHRECRYYIENTNSSNDNIYEEMGIEFTKDYYLPIHSIPCDYTSSCPFYRLVPVNEEATLCVAYCTIFEKYLTRNNVRRCTELWHQCPFYKIGVDTAT